MSDQIQATGEGWIAERDDDVLEQLMTTESEALSVWSNPDIPDVDDLADLAGEGNRDIDIDCPYPTCHNTITLSSTSKLRRAAEKDTLGTFELILVRAYQDVGTVRCEDCLEPLYGIRGHRTGGGPV